MEERRRELAVRVSLGATTRDILRSVLREGNVLILAGIAAGLLFTKYGLPLLFAFIDDAYAYDSFGFALTAAFLFAVALLSALIPAIRATHIDPVDALRHE